MQRNPRFTATSRARGAGLLTGVPAGVVSIGWLTGWLAVASCVGCFGRTEPDGLARSDQPVGAPCDRSAECELSASCVDGVCTLDADGGGDEGGILDPRDCPGFEGFLVLGTVVTGSTTDQVARYTGGCGGDESAEDVWVLELERRTSLLVTTRGSSFDTLIYVRAGCGDTEERLGCNDDGDTDLTSQLMLEDARPGEYYIYVDGYAGSEGDYRLLAVEIGPAGSVPP